MSEEKDLDILFGDAIGAAAWCDAEGEAGRATCYVTLVAKAEAYATAAASGEDDEEAFTAKFYEAYGHFFARAYEERYRFRHF